MPPTERTCPFCDATQFHTAYDLPDEKQVMTSFFLCTNCYSLVPQTALDCGVAMNQTLQVQYHENRWQKGTPEEMQQLLADLKFMVHHLKPHFGQPGPNHSVVELGCGRGGLLRALLDAGFNVSGCEPGARMVEQARQHYGLDEQRLACMPAMDFLDLVEARRQRPNTIVLWHVVEHIRSPMALLERCAKLLGPDGRLILQLPMLNSPDIFPEHYFFFTTHTARYLSRRLGNLPFYLSLDLNNMYLSVFLGDIYKHIQHGGDAELTPEQRIRRALSEPITLRQKRITELQGMLNSAVVQQEAPEPDRVQREQREPPLIARLLRRISGS